MSEQDKLAGALDQALVKTLRGPDLPPGFRERLMGRINAAAGLDQAALHAEIEREYRQRMALMRSEFVRVRWRTLAVLLAAAFVAGGAVTVAMPFLVETFGTYGAYVGPGALALVAVGVAFRAAVRRSQISF